MKSIEYLIQRERYFTAQVSFNKLPCIQITKAEFEKHSHHSEVYKALDKNRDGTIASHELDSKAELAFKVNHCHEI